MAAVVTPGLDPRTVWFNVTRGVLATLGLAWLLFAIVLFERSGRFPDDPVFARVIATTAVGALLWALLHLIAAWRARAGGSWGRATGLSVAVLGGLFALVLFIGGLSQPLPGWMAAVGLLVGLVYGGVLVGLAVGGSV